MSKSDVDLKNAVLNLRDAMIALEGTKYHQPVRAATGALEWALGQSSPESEEFGSMLDGLKDIRQRGAEGN